MEEVEDMGEDGDSSKGKRVRVGTSPRGSPGTAGGQGGQGGPSEGSQVENVIFGSVDLHLVSCFIFPLTALSFRRSRTLLSLHSATLHLHLPSQS